MKNLLEYKKHFNFGQTKRGLLLISRVHSNIYLTFMDIRMKVIICKTSGSSHVGNSKKQKKSPECLVKIVSGILPYLKLYSIKEIAILLRQHVSIHTHMLLKELLFNGYKIARIWNWRKVAHNGLRVRKPRRI